MLDWFDSDKWHAKQQQKAAFEASRAERIFNERQRLYGRDNTELRKQAQEKLDREARQKSMDNLLGSSNVIFR